MSVAKSIVESIEKSSWIRKMFEEGAKLKSLHGEENVFDFSLGNPDLDPPEEFFKILNEFSENNIPGIHGYMSNAGFPDVREVIAKQVSENHGSKINAENIIMTCGAAGGLNTVFKTILNPDDEVIVAKPYFVEYGFYVNNHNGKLVVVDTNDDFSLNVDNIKNAINDKTKAVLINSPNNPTGKIYTEQELSDLSKILEGQKNTVYLISDEPYREIIYTDEKLPSILKLYKQSIVVNSYSKTLSIPGERIGYIAVNPFCNDIELVMNGMILSNRILGYVNAPAIMQRVVARLNEVKVDVETYRRRRNIFIKGLKEAGYTVPVPDGAFYIFCKSPIPDDVEFVKHLLNYNILAVPGKGFGGPGYFRLAYCISEDVITRSIPKFKEAIDSL